MGDMSRWKDPQVMLKTVGGMSLRPQPPLLLGWGLLLG